MSLKDKILKVLKEDLGYEEDASYTDYSSLPPEGKSMEINDKGHHILKRPERGYPETDYEEYLSDVTLVTVKERSGEEKYFLVRSEDRSEIQELVQSAYEFNRKDQIMNIQPLSQNKEAFEHFVELCSEPYESNNVASYRTFLRGGSKVVCFY